MEAAAAARRGGRAGRRRTRRCWPRSASCALRARIPLDAETATAGGQRPAGNYGLTEREVLVLRLVAAGRTNAQIGTELVHQPQDGQRARQ